MPRAPDTSLTARDAARSRHASRQATGPGHRLEHAGRVRHHAFPTALGTCAVAWGPAGIVRIELPGTTDDGDAARAIAAEHPGAPAAEPPATVRRAIEAIQHNLAGDRADLSSVRLDMDGLAPFHRRVYEAARTVPAGTTVTYGELAALAGRPGAARAVGQALGRNPFPVVVPCHRVVAAGGRIGGFSAPGGTTTKQRMLAAEGVTLTAGAPAPAAGRPLPFDARRAERHLRAADPELGQVMAAVGPLRLELRPAPSTFAALTEAIVHQQLSPKAAATIHRRLCALLDGTGILPDASGVQADAGGTLPDASGAQAGAGGHGGVRPEQVLALPEGALRGAGLSAAKVRALRELAAQVIGGAVPTVDEAAAMDDESVVAALSAVRGVGRWTAEMFLMFRLGRPDVLPLGDYGLRRGFAAAFGLATTPGPAEVERRAEAWRPYRTAACWYLWRALDLPR